MDKKYKFNIGDVVTLSEVQDYIQLNVKNDEYRIVHKGELLIVRERKCFHGANEYSFEGDCRTLNSDFGFPEDWFVAAPNKFGFSSRRVD